MVLIRSKSSIPSCLAAMSKSSSLFSSSHLLAQRHCFTSKVVDPTPRTLFIVKYLIESVGLSSLEATKASKSITHIKSPSQPDSVLRFFRKNGFTDTDIRKIIFSYSRVLCSNADSTLKPKLEVLRELGFSETQIIKLVTCNPFSLSYLSSCSIRSRIEFLKGFLCSSDDLVKTLSNDVAFLSSGLERKIKPNISFLKECQISNKGIIFLMTKDQKIIGRSLDSLKTIAKRVVELGIPYGSGMFFYAFRCLCKINSDAVDAKVKFLVSLGFSRAELLSAILIQPGILSLSDKNLCETVNFLVKEVGCDLSYVITHPSMVCFSLTKRLIPRNYVVQLLNEKGLLKKKLNFYYIVTLSEKKFLQRFIWSFKEEMPELHDVYLSASSGLAKVHHNQSREVEEGI